MTDKDAAKEIARQEKRFAVANYGRGRDGEASDCRIAVKEKQHAVLVKSSRGMLLLVR